jgi:hypothetical protein
MHEFGTSREHLGTIAVLNMDLAPSLERYVADRARLVARLRELSAADWTRAARHDEYRAYSVFIMFRHLALHDFLHAYRIEELLLRPDWGMMNELQDKIDQIGADNIGALINLGNSDAILKQAQEDVKAERAKKKTEFKKL